MPFTVTATFETQEEAARFLSRAEPVVVYPAPETPTPPPKPRATAKKAVEDAAPAAPAPTPEPSPSPAAAAPAPAVEPTIPYADLQKSVFELAGLVQKKGLSADEWVLSIARAHGGANFKALAPTTYAAAMVDVKAQIAKAEAHVVQESVA